MKPNFENVTWSHPRWKLFWALSAMLVVCGSMLLAVVPMLDEMTLEAISKEPENEMMIRSFVDKLHPFLYYLASISFWAAYIYFRYTRYSIGISDDNQVCLRTASGKGDCQPASEVTWSDNAMIVGEHVVQGLHTQRIQAITAHNRVFVEQELKPRLPEDNKLSPFQMYSKLIKRFDAQSMFMTYLAVSITFILVWFKL